MTNDIESAYRAIAEDPKYQHFAMIPERIIRCVEYFRIKCDRVDAKDRLLAITFSLALWITPSIPATSNWEASF